MSNDTVTARATRDTLVLSEAFGPTVQGEGPATGRRCGFIRLGGCNLTCSWCFAPDTPVLMADWTEKPISEVQLGDFVWSYRNRRYEIARVERVLVRESAERVAVRFGEREVVCTPDHVFATPHHIDARLRSKAADLTGRHVRTTKLEGWLPDDAIRTHEWWTGWLQGLVLGDGHVGQSAASPYPKVWLRVCDKELAEAFSAEVNRRGARTTVREQNRLTKRGRTVYSVVCALSRIPEAVGLPDTPDEIAGFLAGFFDAEGTAGRGQISMAQADNKTLDRVAGMCRSLNLPVAVMPYDGGRGPGTVTINGLQNVDRFFRMTRPVLTRKSYAHRTPERQLSATQVESVKDVEAGPVVNLTTSTGYFFAGGALVEQCDTGYTWNAEKFDLREELTRTPVADILAQVDAMDVPLIIISGGEPLLHQHQPAWRNLITGLAARGIEVHVETNGTRAPSAVTLNHVAAFSVSPKLAHAGDPEDKRIRPAALTALRDTGKAIFKFVATGEDDLNEIAALTAAVGIPARLVWVMPEGVTPEAVVAGGAAIASAVVDRGWNLTTRLHVLCWPKERAR